MASRDHARSTCAATPESAAGGRIVRYGKWTIAYAPPVPAPPRAWVFTHDEFDGAPDMLDPRHGCCSSIIECLARIAEIEAAGVADDGQPFDATVLSAEELRAISEVLVAEGLLVRTSRGTGYALTPLGRARRAAGRAKPEAA